ncbi:hypothetical protein LI058_04420, partial [Clostridium perfringens]|uniref:hypothetical protein n=1 Tax=Clostridium perfringens TaxID=1502 RepID=UPI00224600BC
CILAQTFNNNKLDFLDSCLNCNLCLSFCCKNKLNISSLNLLAIEDHLFKNICNLAILISKFSEKKFEVFLEVKTDGNSRNKRIDLVCINNATIVLIKVIKSKEDFGKYERSYNSIIDKLHTHKNVKVIFLKKSSIKENYKFSNTIFECTSINNLYNLLINLKGEI